MSDLAKRLRSTSYALPSDGEWVERDGDTMPWNTCTEAADRIEALEAELAQAQDQQFNQGKTLMAQRRVMQLALEVLSDEKYVPTYSQILEAIDELKKALG
jgi:molecular chaperone GrpE (heat shock protein)